MRRALLPRLLTVLACAATLGALAACGESDQEQAREVVQDYVDARTSGDFGAICDLYSDDFKQELGAVDDCEGFVREQSGGGADGEAAEELEIVDVRVRDSDRGIADIDVVRGGEGPARIGLILSRDGDDWKISGLQ
ncbi:MAG: hypothetical protein ACXWZW_10930 [Solirubrobacterales bacterium]